MLGSAVERDAGVKLLSPFPNTRRAPLEKKSCCPFIRIYTAYIEQRASWESFW